MNQTPTPCAHGEPDAVTSRKSGSAGGGEETTGRKADMASRRRPNLSASLTARAAGGIGQRACFAAVASVVDVRAGGPIRGGLQAHVAVAPLAEQSPSADARVAAAEETNGRSVCGDLRRPGSQMTKRNRGSVYQRY